MDTAREGSLEPGGAARVLGYLRRGWTAAPDRPARSLAGIQLRRVAAVGILLAVDWLTVLGCVLASMVARDALVLRFMPSLGPLVPWHTYVADLYFLVPWTVALAEAGFYTRRTLFWDEVRRGLRASTVAALFATFLSFAVQSADQFSRLVIVATWFSTLVAVPVARTSAKRLLARTRLWSRRMLIVGAGDTGSVVYERLRGNPVLGYRPVAFVDDDPARIGGTQDGLPVRGPLATIADVARTLRVSDVLIALPRLPRERLLRLIARCEGSVESIRVVPDMFGLASVGVETEDLDGLLLLHMRWNLAKPWNLALKRGFDLVVASSTLLALGPLLVLAAVAIRRDSPGGILFRQRRL